MEARSPLVLGLFFAAFASVVVWKAVPRISAVAVAAPSGSADALVPPAPSSSAIPTPAEATESSELPLETDSLPPLPDDAPRKIRFGVILFTYEGAERAPARARNKSEARRLAEDVLGTAREHFEEAVARGDRGSTSDAGSIPRGVLDPKLEHALFSLAKGEVCSEVLDTPRGYWVVRRHP